MTPNYSTNDPKGWCGDPSRGAAMGRDSIHDAPADYSGEVVLRRVILDGDYDVNGTYFGAGLPLYWYAGEGIDDVMRARDCGEARAAVLVRYPKAKILERDEGDCVDEIYDGYVRAALWITNDNSTPSGGSPLDENYDADDLAVETAAAMRKTCLEFYRQHRELVERADYPARCESSNLEMVGHDLWLKGFRDGDCLPREVGDLLYDHACEVPETYLYVGDDGKIYGE